MHISDAVVVGDVDGDGDLDLVVGDYNKIRLYLNNGSSNRWQGVSSIELPGEDHRPHVLALGDVDGDGDLDLVEGNIQQPNFVFLNNGTLNPWDGVTPKQLPGGSLHTESVLLGDVDGDGDLDLIVGNINDPNFLCLNNGTADPWMGATATVISASENLTEHLALGDVDNDGDLDLVEGNGNGGSYPNFLYLNNGTSNPWDGVVHGKITDDEYDTRHIELGDVDGDGDLDLVTLNYVQPNRLYLNNGTNAPWAGVAGIDISSDVAQVHGGAIGDVDGDSDLDLLVATGLTEKQKNRLYLNNGTANPWSGVAGTDITNDTFATRTMALGDIDGDGDLDLVTAEANAADGIPEYINHYYINSGFNGGFNGGLSAVDNWEHYR
jgi:hypothetical protein